MFQQTTRSSATAEIARNAVDVVWPFKVAQVHPLLCSGRGIYHHHHHHHNSLLAQLTSY